MDFQTKISPSEVGVQVLQNCLGELLGLFPQLDMAFAALSYAPDLSMSGIGTDGTVIRFSPPDLLQDAIWSAWGRHVIVNEDAGTLSLGN